MANFWFRAEWKKVTSRAENLSARAIARASSARTHHYKSSIISASHFIGLQVPKQTLAWIDLKTSQPLLPQYSLHAAFLHKMHKWCLWQLIYNKQRVWWFLLPESGSYYIHTVVHGSIKIQNLNHEKKRQNFKIFGTKSTDGFLYKYIKLYIF